ncbi:MAG TPA: hypothetical protein VGA51_14925 [Casimicrobiaceae bacterium]
MRRIALLAGAALALAIVAFVLGLRAAGKADAGGFLGPASLLSDLNLTLEILLVLGLTFGMALARSGRIEAHRLNQTSWVLVNAALVLCVMIPSLQNAKPKSLADFAKLSTGLPLLHAALGVLTLAAGLWLVLQINDVLPPRWHTAKWKTLMRLTLTGYWLVALLGIGIYYAWNVG